MNSYFEEAKFRTAECHSIDVQTKDFYLNNKYSLFKKGMPFVVKHFFEIPETTDIVRILIEYFGDRNLRARFQGTVEDYAKNRKYRRIALKEYLEEILKGKSENQPYAANNFIDDNVFELFNIPSPLPEFAERLRAPKIWVGGSGTTTPLHKDSTDNFAIHLYGEKRWSIYSIKDTENLYFEKSPYGDNLNPNAEFQVSKVDLSSISFEKFPFFAKAKGLDVTLSQGDLLYLPYGWGHSVENISVSVMLNIWFKLDDYVPLVCAKIEK